MVVKMGLCGVDGAEIHRRRSGCPRGLAEARVG
jgi:hypothetical protein